MLGVKPVCTPDPHMPMLPLGATTGTPPEAWREMVAWASRQGPCGQISWVGRGAVTPRSIVNGPLNCF